MNSMPRGKKKYFAVISVLLICGAVLSAYFYLLTRPEGLNAVKKWFILLDYRGAESLPDPSEVKKFDMAILDPDSHPPLEEIKDNIILIAYLSVGEAEGYRGYWEEIKDRPWVIGENPFWKENYYVDVRNKEWQKVILDEVIPGIIEKGFKGIFLDTLDTSSMLEEKYPIEHAGSDRAMIGLILAIRESYPELFLISNNGFSILKDIVPFLDGMLTEDINMMPDFEKGGYKKVPKNESAYKVKILNELKKEYNISVFVIDYAPQGDRRALRECIAESKKLGFKPYIAEKELSRIYEN